VIEDRHFHTKIVLGSTPSDLELEIFDKIVDQNRSDFKKPSLGGPERVFGSVAVRGPDGWALISPREKGDMFSSLDAVRCRQMGPMCLESTGKASLNAPLLLRMLSDYPTALAVIHLHDELPGVATLPYAPPGTLRDTYRGPLPPAFNIRGHGYVEILEDV
jgi:hypothetical protein